MLRAIVLLAIFMPSAAATQSLAELSKREKQLTCENLPGMIETTLSTIKSIEVECATDARQHFIPPLEAKLH